MQYLELVIHFQNHISDRISGAILSELAFMLTIVPVVGENG